MKGYAGKLAEIDLTTSKINKIPLDMEDAKKFIGGRGLGNLLLWNCLKPGTDPLSPEAPLIILTGPLTGLAPGGSHTCFVFKSPETGITLGHPVTGGNWGPDLKFAGYDGLIIKGRSDKPVYIYIEDGNVNIKDAKNLWGKGTLETEVLIKKELNDPRARVFSIGIAGERMIKFASVQQEYFRSAARGGSGSLMGSKNLKAVVVKGSKKISIDKPEEFWSAWYEALGKLNDAKTKSRRGYRLTRWGSGISSISHSDVAEMDIKNYREGYWTEIDKIGGLEYERRCQIKARSCYGCAIGCMQVGVIREGIYSGFLVNPDFDSTGTIGPGCLITDLNGLLYLNRLGDDLGVDNISMGNITGFVMECVEKGILNAKDLDGLNLEWGNVPAIEALWNKIINREGIGELLSLGVKKASEKIGKGSGAFAMHVKGLEFGGYAPQAHHDRALQYAVGDRGGCHHYGLTIQEQNHRAWADSLVVCAWHQPFITQDLYLKLLNSATGWELTLEDWNLTAERILALARAFNIREGMLPMRDDVLPERVHMDKFTVGPEMGAYYPKEKFYKDRLEWYKARGCDERGIPKKEYLKSLDLDLAVLELQKLGLY